MLKNYGIKIAGLGTALPSQVVKNTDLEALYETSDEWIYKRTGIKQRRIISANESGLSLSISAAEKALKQANISAFDLDLVIVATCTPDNLYPSMSCLLQGHIGATKAACFDLSAACSGFVYSLITAAQFIYTGMYKNILIVGVDIHSRFMDWNERSVSILFGDGAGAAVLSSCMASEDELIGYSMSASGDINNDLILPNKNICYPQTENSVSPNTVKMNGKAIFEFGVKVVPDVVLKLLDNANLSPGDIDYFVPHQANQRIIDSASKKIGFTPEQVISNVEEVGNTSAASIPLALDSAIKSGKVKLPSKVILAGFGAGLTWASAIVNLNLR